MNEEISYSDVVSSIKGNLPSLPVVMNEIMTVISDHTIALHAIHDLICIDQAISLNILRFANNFEHRQGSERQISDIEEALQRMGLEKVKQVVLNTSVLNLLSKVNFPEEFSFESFWKHSVGVGLASVEIAKATNYSKIDEAYTCGLLHDIGKLAKIHFDQVQFSKEVRSASKKNMDMHGIEIKRNFLRHDFLGSLIADDWKISQKTSLTCKWHHEEKRDKRIDVEDPVDHKLIDIVYFANILVKKLAIGNAGSNIYYLPSDKFLKQKQIGEEDLLQLEEKITDSFQNKYQCVSLLE